MKTGLRGEGARGRDRRRRDERTAQDPQRRRRRGAVADVEPKMDETASKVAGEPVRAPTRPSRSRSGATSSSSRSSTTAKANGARRPRRGRTRRSTRSPPRPRPRPRPQRSDHDPASRARSSSVDTTTPFIGKKHPDFVWKGHPDFGKRENPTLEDYVRSRGRRRARGDRRAGRATCEKGGSATSSASCSRSRVTSAPPSSAPTPALLHKPVMRVEGACASGGLAFASAVESIQAGTDVALVAGVEIQTTESARTGGDYLARAVPLPAAAGDRRLHVPGVVRGPHEGLPRGVRRDRRGHRAGVGQGLRQREPQPARPHARGEDGPRRPQRGLATRTRTSCRTPSSRPTSR